MKNGLNDMGACGAASKEDETVSESHLSSVRGFCIEPMAANFQVMTSSFSSLGYTAPFVTLTNAAVSSLPGWVRFSNGTAGAEGFGMDEADGGPDEPIPAGGVPVLSLDQYVERNKIDMIDWLSIDTEGNDARVIFGGSRLFAAQKVRVFEFEVHAVNHWLKSDLEDLIDLLDNYGYTCYWETNNGNLVQISGCWAPPYNQHPWRNVACVLRTEPIFELMDKLAWKR